MDPRFNRLETPTHLSEFDRDYLNALIGTTLTEEGVSITFLSILSVRELLILFNALLIKDGVTTEVVAKVAISYEILAHEAYIIEELYSEEGIDITPQYIQKSEEYILTQEQTKWLAPRFIEAVDTFKYTDAYIEAVQGEYYTHEDIAKHGDQILKCYGLYFFDNVVVYVIEKLGKNLFYEHPSLEVIARDVIRDIQTVHKAGYFHRDVTPGNIVNNNRGDVSLIDFGIATPIWAAKGGTIRIVTGNTKKYTLFTGNPSFCSAVSFLGEYNHASDLEGLCYTLECLYHPEGIPWGYKKWSDDQAEESYHLRLQFTPTNEKVRQLLTYLRSIGDEVPDYEKCISFFD